MDEDCRCAAEPTRRGSGRRSRPPTLPACPVRVLSRGLHSLANGMIGPECFSALRPASLCYAARSTFACAQARPSASNKQTTAPGIDGNQPSRLCFEPMHKSDPVLLNSLPRALRSWACGSPSCATDVRRMRRGPWRPGLAPTTGLLRPRRLQIQLSEPPAAFGHVLGDPADRCTGVRCCTIGCSRRRAIDRTGGLPIRAVRTHANALSSVATRGLVADRSL